GADGGEEPRQEPAEITAEHAARSVGPAGSALEGQLREDRAGDHQQAEGEELRTAAAVAIASDEEVDGVEDRERQHVGADAQKPAQGLGDEVTHGADGVLEAGTHAILGVEGRDRQEHEDRDGQQEGDEERTPATAAPGSLGGGTGATLLLEGP